MARTTTVSVTLKDRVNQSGSMSFTFERGFLAALGNFLGWDEAKADALMDFAANYSNAEVIRSGVANAKTYTLPPGFIGGPDIEKGFDLVDQKAVLVFRDEDSGASHIVTIPAPNEAMFISVLGEGLRVDPTMGATMAGELGPILGLSLVFEKGWHEGRK